MKKGKLVISTDKRKLDLRFVNHFLSNTHWAKNRTMAEMRILVKHSLNFGVYLDNRQIGYARVVTDYVQFAYLMDVFIDESFRGHGYSKKLMKYIIGFEKVKNIKVWRLATDNAHQLYARFGFTLISKPEKMMERIRK